MALQNIVVEVGGKYSDIDRIVSVEIGEAYKQPAARFRMEVENIGSFGINDDITITLGYTGNTVKLFEGFIDTITSTRRPGIFELTGRDIIKFAQEHWIVTTDLDEPWSRSNISAENLVGDLLAEASITDYSGDASSFTFGVSNPAEFQLVSSWDAIERICNILAWRCYAENGTVYFQSMLPEPSGAPIAYLRRGDSGEITQIGHESSTENLRNKVVVFGREGIYAEASAESPYLPEGFYKTAVVSSELIDTQSMADDSADYNLALYNRLTEVVRLDILGNPSIRARKTVNVKEWFTGVKGDWFVYSCTHRIDENGGYTTQMHLLK